MTVETRHRLKIVALCPVNDSHDIYEVEVVTDAVLPVEEILDAVAELTRQPIYQETLTEELADRLKATVTSYGSHSGVRTVCVAEGDPQ